MVRQQLRQRQLIMSVYFFCEILVLTGIDEAFSAGFWCRKICRSGGDKFSLTESRCLPL